MPNSQNDATYSLLPPTDPKITTASDVDILLDVDTIKAEMNTSELNGADHRIEGHSRVYSLEQQTLATKNILANTTERLDVEKVLELPIQLLTKDRAPAQTGLNDIQENEEPWSSMVPVNLTCDQTFSHEGLGRPGEHTKMPSELRHVYATTVNLTPELSLLPGGHQHKPVYLDSLGIAYKRLFNRLAKREHFLMATDRHTQALTLAPEGLSAKLACLLNSVGDTFQILFQHLGKLVYLYFAVICNAQAVALTPDDDHTHKPVYLGSLGSAYITLFKRLGKLKHIHMAVNCLTQAVALTFDDHPNKSDCLDCLALAYQALFDRLGKLEHIHIATNYHTQALKLTPEGHPGRSARLSNVGITFQILFRRIGKLEHLHTAADYLAQAVELTPDDHPQKRVFLNNLGGIYMTLFDRLGKPEHIHMAVSCLTQAVTLTPDGHPEKPTCLGNLGNAYVQILLRQSGQLEYAHMAIDYLTQAVALTPEGHPDRPVHLDNIGTAYQILSDRLGQLEYLYIAAEYKAQAVAHTPDSHQIRPFLLNHLGNVYQRLFNRLGKLEHIHMAIDYRTQALKLTPAGHSDQPTLLNNLGAAYWALFSRLGELEHVHMALEYIARSIVLTPEGHPHKPERLNSLGAAYWRLFNRLGELKHAHMAFECMKQAEALTPNNHPDKPSYLSNLGVAYSEMFDRLGQLEHIRMAINYRLQAVALTPEGHPDKPILLSNLGSTYLKLFDHLGQLEHAHMGTSYLVQAVVLTPDSHPAKSRHLNNLANAYMRLFNLSFGELEYLHLAINCATQAVELIPEEDPSGVQRLHRLGQLYFALFTSSLELEHVAMSKRYFRCAALFPTGNPDDRLLAARHWAWLCTPGGSDALEAYSHCKLRLPEAVWLGTSVQRRLECLKASDVQDLVSEAVWVAILANRYDLVVEWLEQGLCLVWSQMLQLHTPLDKLHASHPELANELYRLSTQLEDIDSRARNGETSNIHAELLRNDAYTRSQLAYRRDQLINSIRLKPGFDGFLRPPNALTITSHVQHGATVILTTHAVECDAIIIKQGVHAITHIPLVNFSCRKAEELRRELVLCLKSQGIARGFKKGDFPLQASFKNILATLWLDVVKPVLDHLRISQVVPIDNLPHITWCITGALSFLPVHAAGIYDDPSTVLSNLAISSYTPTISSMGQSRSTPPNFSGILAVGHQSGVRGLSPLPGTKDELDKVKEQFENRRFTRLEEDAATIDAVVEAMGDHSWVHFACHGSQDPLDPMNSALHLHDKDLTLAMISKHSTENAQLAFLSACQTAKGDSELPNEAVHLAAGLLMAGYANVIATMWSIKDQDAPIVAAEVYKCLLEDGVPDSRKAAKALHRAVKHLQDTIGLNEFARWVPYIHMGG